MSLYGNDCPWQGNTYYISEMDTDNVLTYKGRGRVTLEPFEGGDSQRWICELHHGWLGFKMTTDENSFYLALYNDDELWCGVQEHQEGWRSFFTAFQHPAGGYRLALPRNDATILRTLGKRGSGAIGTADGSDTRWGFTKLQ